MKLNFFLVHCCMVSTTISIISQPLPHSDLPSHQEKEKDQTNYLLPLPRDQIHDLWLSACDPERQKSPACCASWERVVNKAEARLYDFWNPVTNISNDDIHRFDDYEPHWNCASRERLPARAGDGPKWVCGLDTFKDSKPLVYSFGSDGDTQFEEGVLERTHSPDIYIFDPSK